MLALLVLLTGCATPAAAPAGEATSREPVASPAPTGLRIPQIAARSTLIPTGLIDLPDTATVERIPQVPPVDEPMQASWASFTPPPGDIGPSVLYGHVDGQVNDRRGVPGIFNRIDELAPGNLILVDRDDGSTAQFAVTHIERYPKVDFSDPASTATREVYGDTAAAELRLVTCGGTFDRDARSYRDQLVVFATLLA
ncbi:hypothetical protein WY02_03465 [Pseudonocardia sp. AL041005-10]|nr:hypothetical protein WY02_03465 [Pseudonocardia sp. AL041005-10]